MSTTDVLPVVLRLKAFRSNLAHLSRNVKHALCLASERGTLAKRPVGQFRRRVPFAGGARRDVFFWDICELNGEAGLKSFFKIAELIGRELHRLQGTEAARLLPGTCQEIVGKGRNLFRPDYWLFVVHHLGWTGQLPYECRTLWTHGQSLEDESFSMTSRLPVNLVKASIDAISVLIGSICEDDYDDDEVEEEKATRRLKRRDRAAGIDALRKELVQHIKAAREFAQAAIDEGREPQLLPRPLRTDLAERLGMSNSAVSRCFNDSAAAELKLLWKTAGDLEAVMKFVRR